MIKYLATASLLLAGAYLSTGHALAADPGITDTEIVIGDVEPLTGPPALLGVAASIGQRSRLRKPMPPAASTAARSNTCWKTTVTSPRAPSRDVKKVIDVDKAFALLGISGSGQSIAAMPVLEKAGNSHRDHVAPVKFLWEPPRKNVFIVGQSYEEGIHAARQISCARRIPARNGV